MFARFRQTRSRLQVALVETRRVDGKVRQEHVASLGSLAHPPTVADRVAFCASLFGRTARLSNRLGPEALAKVMGDIHARVPMVTIDEQRALQLENAKVDADQWAAIRDLNASKASEQESLIVTVNEEITNGKARAADADNEVKAAQGRIDAIERGESAVGGLGKPEELADLLKRAGFSKADLRHSRLLAAVPEEHFEEFLREYVGSKEKIERRLSTRAARAILRKYAEG